MCIFAVDFKAVYYDFPLVLFCDMIVETSMHRCDAYRRCVKRRTIFLLAPMAADARVGILTTGVLVVHIRPWILCYCEVEVTVLSRVIKL